MNDNRLFLVVDFSGYSTKIIIELCGKYKERRRFQ
jgi:hypothetical protein